VAYKIPISVLVVIHTPDLQLLLIERAGRPGFWQSVTGSVERMDEPLELTAVREVAEETGIDATQFRLTNWRKQNLFEIFTRWSYRFAPGTTHNLEHVFSLEVPGPMNTRNTSGCRGRKRLKNVSRGQTVRRSANCPADCATPVR
jgi:dATP pyrophosphohydrolase